MQEKLRLFDQNLLFNKVAQACNFIKKGTLEQVLSCEFCGISKNRFSKELLRATASLIISENKPWKALLYYSNFAKVITECNQKCWTFPLRSSFVLRKNGCFVTRLCTFAHSYSPTHFLNLQEHQIYCGRDPALAYPALFLS